MGAFKMTLEVSSWLEEEDAMESERFGCSQDAVFSLFHELMESSEPSKTEIFQALHYLARRCGMARVAFEIEDLGVEKVL
jgi:DNA-binding phage protein